MAAHSGSDTLRLHRVGPSLCASALALDTRHRPVCGMTGRSRHSVARINIRTTYAFWPWAPMTDGALTT
jgi:hypothetical protein